MQSVYCLNCCILAVYVFMYSCYCMGGVCIIYVYRMERE